MQKKNQSAWCQAGSVPGQGILGKTGEIDATLAHQYSIRKQLDDGAGKNSHGYGFPRHQDCTCEAQHGYEGEASLKVVQHLPTGEQGRHFQQE